jgi:glutathione S-transferase
MTSNSSVSTSTTTSTNTTTSTPSLKKNPVLYYSSTSCGAASFIACHLAKLPIQCFSVDLTTHKLLDGTDFYKINSKGNVPTIVLTDGTILNETTSCFLWINQQYQQQQQQTKNNNNHKEKAILPPLNDENKIDFFKAVNILSWIGTELQPSITRLFPKTVEEQCLAVFVNSLKERAVKQLNHFQFLLGNHSFLLDHQLLAIDLIGHIVLGWAIKLNLLSKESHPLLIEYVKRVKQHPTVVTATQWMNTNPTVCYKFKN